MLSVFPRGYFQSDSVPVTILLVPIRCQTVIGTVSSSFWGFAEKRGEREKPGAKRGLSRALAAPSPVGPPQKGQTGWCGAHWATKRGLSAGLGPGFAGCGSSEATASSSRGCRLSVRRQQRLPRYLQGFAVCLYFRSCVITFLRSALHIAIAPSFCSGICRGAEALPEQ